jgi:hypothetical protein
LDLVVEPYLTAVENGPRVTERREERFGEFLPHRKMKKIKIC